MLNEWQEQDWSKEDKIGSCDTPAFNKNTTTTYRLSLKPNLPPKERDGDEKSKE